MAVNYLPQEPESSIIQELFCPRFAVGSTNIIIIIVIIIYAF